MIPNRPFDRTVGLGDSIAVNGTCLTVAEIDGEKLDLAKVKKVSNFKRELNMKCGLLSRSFEVQLVSGKKLSVKSQRFCSIADDELGAIRYEIKALNFSREA